MTANNLSVFYVFYQRRYTFLPLASNQIKVKGLVEENESANESENESKSKSKRAMEANHQLSSEEYVKDISSVLASFSPDKFIDSSTFNEFIDALTHVAALPCDEDGIRVRSELFFSSETSISENLLACLEVSDLHMKCKAANALGSLCVVNEVAMAIAKQHGDRLFQSLRKLLSSKNEWAQGDALFVLGWVVNCFEQSEKCSWLIRPTIRVMKRSAFRSSNTADAEQQENIRTYGLIVLSNLAVKHAQLFETMESPEGFLEFVVQVLKDTSSQLYLQEESINDRSSAKESFRLVASLLRNLLFQIPSFREIALQKAVLPSVIHVIGTLRKKGLHTEQTENEWRVGYDLLNDAVQCVVEHNKNPQL